MTTATRPRPDPANQGLYYSFEKAGLTVDRQPIPWNAEAVLVEANVRFANTNSIAIQDFSLSLPDAPPLSAETTRPGSGGQTHIFFRLAVPRETTSAEVRWRNQSLGRINLPLLTEAEFLAGLAIHHSTIHVRTKDDAFACQAYVNSQAKDVLAAMMIQSPTCLAPIVDLELGANLIAGDQLLSRRVVRLESEQLAARQALVVVPFDRPRASVKEWTIAWTVGDQIRASQSVRAVRPAEFLASLRISTTRLYLESEQGMLPLARFAPASLDGIRRVGPVFLVTSGIPGMAASADFRVRALDRSRRPIIDLPEVRTLVTGGPTVIAPGTLGCDDTLGSFELLCGARRLGEVSILPIPTAAFTGEGGIVNAHTDFTWSRDAEDQLQHRLGQLLGGD